MALHCRYRMYWELLNHQKNKNKCLLPSDIFPFLWTPPPELASYLRMRQILNSCLRLFAQGGEVHRPGHQARQCGGLVQVGGEDPRRRGEGHGRHRPHAVQTGLRPPRQPPQLRQAWPQSPGQHQKGESRLQLILTRVKRAPVSTTQHGPGNI